MSRSPHRHLALAAAGIAAVILLLTAIGGSRADARDLMTSLETPPTADEVKAAFAAGVRNFDIDLDKPGADLAAAAIKAAKARLSAYHVGGGGGRAWGSVAAGEQVRKYDTPEELAILTEDVKRLVGLGADSIHFDNTHRMSGKRLEAIADAIKAGGADFVAKNNADKWNLVMRRRKDLVPAYAIVEDAILDADETEAARELAEKGVNVYVVAFRKPIAPDGQAVTDDIAKAFKAANPWAKVLLMEDEQAFDSRSGTWID